MICASSSPTPTSTIWPSRCDVPRVADRAGGTGLRRCARRDGGHPDRGFPAPGGHRRRVARPRAQRDHRPDGPARRPPVRARLRRRTAARRPGEDRSRTRAGWPAARWLRARTRSANCPTRSPLPGRGQIRAMVINCGNPVVSGTRRSQARQGARTTGSVGGHRLRAAREPPSRALAVARRALAGTRRPAGVHQQHARRAVSAVRGQGRRPAAGRPSGVADLRRPRDRHAQAAVRRQGAQRLHQGHPATRAADAQAARSSSGRTGSTGWSWPPDERSTAAGSNGATSWPTRTAGCWARASSDTSRTRCEPTTRRCTPRRRSSSSGPANCSPSRIRRRRRTIRSSWRTGATGIR